MSGTGNNLTLTSHLSADFLLLNALEGLDGFMHLQTHLNLLDVEELQRSGFREQWVSIGPAALSSTTILLMLTGKLPIGVSRLIVFLFFHVSSCFDKT